MGTWSCRVEIRTCRMLIHPVLRSQPDQRLPGGAYCAAAISPHCNLDINQVHGEIPRNNRTHETLAFQVSTPSSLRHFSRPSMRIILRASQALSQPDIYYLLVLGLILRGHGPSSLCVFTILLPAMVSLASIGHFLRMASLAPLQNHRCQISS